MDVISATSVFLIKYVFFILVILLTILYLYVSRDYDYWKKRGVRYKKPQLFFGNLEFLMRRSASDFFLDLGVEYGRPYVGVFLGKKPALVIHDAELAKKILLKDSVAFQDRFLYSGKSDPLGSLNLFTVKNPTWAEMRKKLSPMFSTSSLRELSRLMNQNATELVSRIEREHVDQKNAVNLKDLFCRYTSDTVGFTVFGLRSSALRHDHNPLWVVSVHMVKWTFWRGLEFALTFFVPALASLLRVKFFSEAATEYVKKIFKDQVEERQKTGTDDKSDLVSRLMRIKDHIKVAPGNPEFRENLMMAQAAVFILGAIETSSSTIAYCLHELSYHPVEQDKLYEEIDKLVQKDKKTILDYDDLSQMKYLNSCIQETLRKHVPVPFAERMCQRDYQLDEHLVLERGTPVYVNLPAIHHDPAYYPEPDRWNPDRFSGINPDNDHRNFTFLPFGQGPRFCIGKRYGMVQIRAAIAQIVHKFKVEPASPYVVESDPYSVILSPKNGGSVRFVPRI